LGAVSGGGYDVVPTVSRYLRVCLEVLLDEGRLAHVLLAPDAVAAADAVPQRRVVGSAVRLPRGFEAAVKKEEEEKEGKNDEPPRAFNAIE